MYIKIKTRLHSDIQKQSYKFEPWQGQRTQHSGDASLSANVLGVWTHLIPQQINFSHLSALACAVPTTWKALLVLSLLHLPVSKRLTALYLSYLQIGDNTSSYLPELL